MNINVNAFTDKPTHACKNHDIIFEARAYCRQSVPHYWEPQPQPIGQWPVCAHDHSINKIKGNHQLRSTTRLLVACRDGDNHRDWNGK